MASPTGEVLARAIKVEAQRLGFHLVGITGPEPPAHLEVFEGWLASGHQAGMDYLATERSRERRADPRQILPECQSIVVLGIRYPAPPFSATQNHTTEPRGKVAAYAWGLDYHEVLPPRLQALALFIEAQVGAPVPQRWYTDTGPILEREIAQRAGLGWIGKNTCLIHPQQGSYILLAELLLGIDLEPDAPFVDDRCGSCTRCLEACPTECILPERTIDSSRCISYLTIEHKGSIPIELRASVGSWVFGCDICQQVCPWNQRFGDQPPDLELEAGADSADPLLIRELGLGTSEFNRKYSHRPHMRTKRRGYLRNVAVALGNSGDPDAVPALAETLLNDTEALVRSHAAWALGKIDGQEAQAALEKAALQETDAEVRAEIETALQMVE